LRPPIIYRGLFGSAGFQSLYASEPAFRLMLCTALEYHLLVTLPLWVLAATFHYLLPLALTSVMLSLGVCATAGAQAALPKTRRHWWSRPLVSVLFLLQPIVRGWARYQGRLTARQRAATTQQSLDSLALFHSGKSLAEVQYWAEQRVNRLDLVADLLRRLDQQGWPNRADIGWGDYDVEIYGSRWSSVQLATVAEDHPPGRQMLRCRLRPRWSLMAKLAFWGLCGLELLLLGFVGTGLRWWGWLLSLAVLPLFIWWLRHEQRSLQSMVTVFLDTLAKDWNLLNVSREAPAESRAAKRAPILRTDPDKAPQLSTATGPGP
jgi:hypothetical protein